MVNELTDFFELRNNYSNYSQIESELIYGNEKIKKTFITVVIPTYKRCSSLKNTIESVINQVNYDDFIIIVVDNQYKRDSDTENMIKNLNYERILYYQNKDNIGQIANWNRGIEIAQSEWVILLHDDDMLKSNYFEEVVSIIKNNPDIQALGTVSDTFEFENKNKIINNDITWKTKVKKLIKSRFRGNITKLTLKDYYFESGYYAPIGCLYKRENVIKIGGFNEDFFPISDWVFHVNYMLKYNLYIVSSVLTSRGIGINDSLLKKYRIGFIEKGYYFRKAILKRRKSLLGEWWIQIVTWYNAKINYKLETDDLKKNMLKIKYDTKMYKWIYLLIYRLYNITKTY
ncbi:glycosyltransferase family 2 protein [Anaerocolumna sp. MB42-C2]|uniref:glycosyltransferase family 2 protein n=1 Tax=Anaerocolumna sp. MB42-C2 TaxID=3070997 RepID=UPI0027DEFF5D|nr:glycosyltransferase family 2 protein [Anaerocolumna sp. MB42-C2]WMJ89805.1 glycosyltransferase family 2 protein [Anaerocolumna sp. MB42-C2]